jgi:hypothetical protein
MKQKLVWVHDPIKDILGSGTKKVCKINDGCVVNHTCTCHGGNGFTCDSTFKFKFA